MRASSAAVTGAEVGAGAPLAMRLRTLVLLRLGVGAAVLLLLLFTEWFRLDPEADAAGPPVASELASPLVRAGFLLVAVLVVDVLFAMALRFPVGGGRVAAAVQVGADLLLVTALVYVTHGPAASPLAVLYFGPVVAAPLLLPLAGALLAALVAAGGLVAVEALYIAASRAGGSLPLIGDTAPPGLAWTPAGAGTLAAFGTAFLGVTLLGSTLAGRLSRARVLLDEVLQSLDEGVIAVDPSARVAFANAEARRLLGLTAGARVADRPLAALAPAAAPVLQALAVAGHGGPSEVDLPGAPQEVIEATATPVRDDAGRTRGTVLVLRDVTLRREVARARQQAERLREVHEMSAGLAHEIRNPLASVRGAIQALMEGTSATTEVRRLMQLAITESDRLDGIITEFLEFAAMRSPRPVRQSARALLDEVTLLLRARALPPGVAVATRVENGCALFGDGDQLRQVLLNLALNGVEAMRERGGTLTLAARPAPRGGTELAVQDTGVGVAAPDLPKLGTPFYSSRPQGTGLGLAIVHRIVGAHGGHVRIESTLDVGTTVTCTLPPEEPPR
jgi:signal transduction histidine kinase